MSALRWGRKVLYVHAPIQVRDPIESVRRGPGWKTRRHITGKYKRDKRGQDPEDYQKGEQSSLPSWGYFCSERCRRSSLALPPSSWKCGALGVTQAHATPFTTACAIRSILLRKAALADMSHGLCITQFLSCIVVYMFACELHFWNPIVTTSGNGRFLFNQTSWLLFGCPLK